jgi:hypothetical protein
MVAPRRLLRLGDGEVLLPRLCREGVRAATAAAAAAAGHGRPGLVGLRRSLGASGARRRLLLLDHRRAVVELDLLRRCVDHQRAALLFEARHLLAELHAGLA